jgi:hypothetical protein
MSDVTSRRQRWPISGGLAVLPSAAASPNSPPVATCDFCFHFSFGAWALFSWFLVTMSTSCGDDGLEDIEDLVQPDNPKAQARRKGNQAGSENNQVN